MFTRDVITGVHEFIGAGTYQYAPAGDWYIVGTHIQQSGNASDTLVQCGTTTVSRNYGKDTADVTENYHCVGAITGSKTGNDSSFVTVSYIPSDQFSNQLIASVSGQIGLSPAAARGMGDIFVVFWIVCALVLVYCGFFMATYIYRK